MDAWSRHPTEPKDPVSNRTFVQSWKFEDLVEELDSGIQGRSKEIGQRIFKEATCAQCHKIGDQGGAVGPALNDVFRRWKGDSRAVLREILEPSHRIDPKYAMHVIRTVEGEVISGIVQREDRDSIAIIDNPESGKARVIPREDIDDIVKDIQVHDAQGVDGSIHTRRDLRIGRVPQRTGEALMAPVASPASNLLASWSLGRGLALWLATLAAIPSWAASPRPNLVLLLADDQCTYSLGCYGAPRVKTPNLDALAREGMAFDRHYDTTAICMASRASIMTGMLEYKTGCNFDRGPLLAPMWRRSYPTLLREAGYLTAMAGKFGFLVASKPGAKGRMPSDDFDRWGGSPGQTSYVTAKNESIAHYADRYPHSTLAYGAFGRDFIREAAGAARPFCLSISFKAPHRPVTPDPKFDDVYAGQQFVKPGNYGRRHGLHFSAQSRTGRQYPRFQQWSYDRDYDGVMARYYQQIYAIDVAVKMIRDALVQQGVADNTVVIFTSDNGFFCGSHGYGSKVLPYEEASRVPLIVYDPRHANSGKRLRCGALTGNVDLAPTLLHLAGLARPDNMDGRSLLPLYDNPQAEIHQDLPLINVWGPESCHSLSVVTRDWKYIYWPYDKKGMQPTEELYHLSKDPLELRNAAGDDQCPEELETMRQRYDARIDHWRRQAVSHHRYPAAVQQLSRRPKR